MKYPFNVRSTVGEDFQKSKYVLLWAEHGDYPLPGALAREAHGAHCGMMFTLPMVKDVEQAEKLREDLSKCIQVLNDFIGEE